MCLLSETKLAIDDLYERCTKRSMEAINYEETDQEAPVAEREKTWGEKLHTLQFRVLDLQGK